MSTGRPNETSRLVVRADGASTDLDALMRDASVPPLKSGATDDASWDEHADTVLARVKALQAFMATDDGANLLAGYKRAANILKQAEKDGAIPAAGEGASTIAAPAFAGAADVDRALLAALDAAEPAASAAVADERFTDAMAALASLRAPIDAPSARVMVNDPDPAARAWRLGLLARFRDAVHSVADFSKIEG